MSKTIEEAKREKAERLDNSALYDVHRWSDYSEVNAMVNAIYEEMKSDSKYGAGKEKLRKEHIKPLILDLYVKWLTDPSMYSAIHRRKEHYTKVDGRYNKLHIKYDNTITAMDFLFEHGYAEYERGSYNRDGKHKSRISRLRATKKLTDLITHDFSIQPHMVERAPNTECIILRDLNEDKTKQVDIPYDDTEYTNSIRKELYAYNNLLRQVFIDIPEYPSDGIPTTSGKKRIKITQHEKFVRRIFNNGTFEDGGRYYGGWWQRIPKEWRSKIRIGTPVTEIDYSGLHIILLYALEGIDYWESIGLDPYKIAGVEESERMRALLKQILLSAINAKDKNAAIKSVRWKINTDLDEYGWIYEEDIDLNELVDKFTSTHKNIYKYFFSGYGVRLQNIDSNIASHVVNHFTDKGIPVLCIHDSFVIDTNHAEELQLVMNKAFDKVIKEYGAEEIMNKQKVTGMEIGKWAVLTSYPDYRDEMIDTLIKTKYDQPEWKKRMDEFKKIDRKDIYYKSDMDNK